MALDVSKDSVCCVGWEISYSRIITTALVQCSSDAYSLQGSLIVDASIVKALLLECIGVYRMVEWYIDW